MFSPFQLAYPQRLPSYYSDNDYAYLDRGYLRALAQQRARERREAQYHAQLEAIRRQAYQEQLARQEAARRRNSVFFGGFNEEPWSLRRDHPSNKDDMWAEASDAPSRHLHVNDNLHQAGENHMNSPRESHQFSIPITQSQADIQTTRSLSEPSCQADTRDAAARKIQAFTRRVLPCLRSLRAIAAISQQFSETQESFHFPGELDFDVASGMDATPSLIFTPRNTPLHAHEHALVKLLSALDAVDSHGDVRVREARKYLVKRIESALTDLDAQKETMWREMKGKTSRHAEMPDGLAKANACEPESVCRDLETPPQRSALEDFSSEEVEVEKELSSRPEEAIPGDKGISGSSTLNGVSDSQIIQ